MTGKGLGIYLHPVLSSGGRGSWRDSLFRIQLDYTGKRIACLLFRQQARLFTQTERIESFKFLPDREKGKQRATRTKPHVFYAAGA